MASRIAAAKIAFRQGTAMREYRAYIIGHDGHIQKSFEFRCSDDEVAKKQAKQYVDRQDVELWHRAQKVAAFKGKQ